MSVLENGLSVASVDNNSPVATVAIVTKAGTRYETYDNLGSAHALKIFAGTSGKNHTGFAIIRNLQQIGSDLDCNYDRETLSYSATILKDSVNAGKSTL